MEKPTLHDRVAEQLQQELARMRVQDYRGTKLLELIELCFDIADGNVKVKNKEAAIEEHMKEIHTIVHRRIAA